MGQDMKNMTEILGNLRKKYQQVNRLMDQTRELDQAIRSGDDITIRMSLDMRGQTMAAVDKLDEENLRLAAGLSEAARKTMMSLLKPSGETPRLSNPLEIDVYDTQQRIFGTLQRAVALDDEIRKRTGGK